MTSQGLVTLDTTQTISGAKTFSNANIVFSGIGTATSSTMLFIDSNGKITKSPVPDISWTSVDGETNVNRIIDSRIFTGQAGGLLTAANDFSNYATTESRKVLITTGTGIYVGPSADGQSNGGDIAIISNGVEPNYPAGLQPHRFVFTDDYGHLTTIDSPLKGYYMSYNYNPTVKTDATFMKFFTNEEYPLTESYERLFTMVENYEFIACDLVFKIGIKVGNIIGSKDDGTWNYRNSESYRGTSNTTWGWGSYRFDSDLYWEVIFTPSSANGNKGGKMQMHLKKFKTFSVSSAQIVVFVSGHIYGAYKMDGVLTSS